MFDEPFTGAENLTQLRTNPKFERLVDRYKVGPESSLIPPVSRAFLHHWIVEKPARRILEIGTYLAGTTQVLAAALNETGQTGQITTIDAVQMAPREQLVSSWPVGLDNLVDFKIDASAKYFGELFLNGVSEEQKFDMIFVDGNHDYEFALFDLQASARAVRTGGIIILDNIDQPGPSEAARSFLDENPDWIDCDNAIGDWAATNWLSEPRPILDHSSFFAVIKPAKIAIRGRSVSFNIVSHKTSRIVGLILTLAAPAVGRIKAVVYSRAFGGGRNPQEFRSTIVRSIDVQEPNRLEIVLDQPLECTIAPGPETTYYLQVNLSFYGESAQQGLILAKEVELLHH